MKKALKEQKKLREFVFSSSFSLGTSVDVVLGSEDGVDYFEMPETTKTFDRKLFNVGDYITVTYVEKHFSGVVNEIGENSK